MNPLFRSRYGLAPVLLIGLGLLLATCSKKDSTPTIDFGPNEGFSYRERNNIPAGTQDPTDWTVDASWNSQEQALFSSLNVNVNGTGAGSLTSASAYPNPAVSSVTFQYSTPGAASGKFVVVDNTYRVLQESAAPIPFTGFAYTLDLTSSGFQKGQRYRIYYLLYNGTTLYCKGHGDIKVAD